MIVRKVLVATLLMGSAQLWQSCGRRTTGTLTDATSSSKVTYQLYGGFDSISIGRSVAFAVDSPCLRIVRRDSTGIQDVELTGRRAVVLAQSQARRTTKSAYMCADSLSSHAQTSTAVTRSGWPPWWHRVLWAALAVAVFLSLLSSRGIRPR